MRLLHITTAAEWDAAQARGTHEPDSLRTEGFVHCSTPAQIAGVARRFFRGQRGLVLLEIDPDRLGAEVRFENTEGGEELFPHVYGVIEVAAVIGVRPWSVDTRTAGRSSGGE